MKRNRWVWLFLATILSGLLSGCAVKETVKGRTEDGRLRVVATTGMVADVGQNVGGEYVEVTALMGPGVDPHLYLRDVLARLPAMTNRDDLDPLLPCNWRQP